MREKRIFVRFPAGFAGLLAKHDRGEYKKSWIPQIVFRREPGSAR